MNQKSKICFSAFSVAAKNWNVLEFMPCGFRQWHASVLTSLILQGSVYILKYLKLPQIFFSWPTSSLTSYSQVQEFMYVIDNFSRQFGCNCLVLEVKRVEKKGVSQLVSLFLGDSCYSLRLFNLPIKTQPLLSSCRCNRKMYVFCLK